MYAHHKIVQAIYIILQNDAILLRTMGKVHVLTTPALCINLLRVKENQDRNSIIIRAVPRIEFFCKNCSPASWYKLLYPLVAALGGAQ